MIHPAQWLIENRVIYTYGEGIVSLAEMREHSQHVIALLDEGIGPVHIVLDSSPDFRPETVDLRSGLDNLSFVHHRSIGWTVQIVRRQSRDALCCPFDSPLCPYQLPGR